MKRFAVVLSAMTAVLYGTPVWGQVHFGVKAGLNTSSVHFSKVSTDWKTGFQLGPTVEAMIPLFGIGADAAIVYSNKNGGQIEAPIHGKWKVGIPMAKLFLATGPYFGFPLSGNEVKEEVKETLHSLKTKSFQMGWDFGGGVELLKHLQVGLNYSLGLTDNYNEQTVDAAKLLKGKDRGWSLTAAWLF